MVRTFILLILPFFSLANENESVIYKDIETFWNAYDLLEDSSSYKDSVAVIQQEYYDKATPQFKAIIKEKNFTADELVKKIRAYPKYWNSVREKTFQIDQYFKDVEVAVNQFKKNVPDYKPVEVCFAIGCIRNGGTVSGNIVFIGTEMVMADQEVDKSELSNWHQKVLGNFNVLSLISHEMVHTQQKRDRSKSARKNRLLINCINEGVADFLSNKFTGYESAPGRYKYGMERECDIWKAFSKELKNNPRDFSNWLYNSNNAKEFEADMGYFVGHRIAEEYYNKQADKNQAIQDLLDESKYRKIFKESGYASICD